MQVITDLTPSPKHTAIALGYFDGVHIAHQKILAAAALCKKQGLTPAAFTFTSTPKEKDRLIQLNTREQKYALLEKAGVEILYTADFDSVKNLTEQEFVTDIVKNVFNAKKVFCGFNYRFGKNGSGNTDSLQRLCNESKIEACILQSVEIDKTVVSSSAIRQFLQQGKIELANKFLGYDYGFVSTSVEGNHIGTLMDTPTINQTIEANLVLPKFGVYASLVTVGNEQYYGVTNIGVKPTIGEGYSPLCETWLPLYKGGDLYGKKVDTRLKVFIRPERKFESIDKLQNAIKNDGNTAVNILKNM